jgi:tRNA modification GTPase
LADRIFRARRANLKLVEATDRTMNLGDICDQNGEPLDEVLVAVMRAPHSYTCQDVVEINSHGGLVAVNRILERVLQEGARLAEPGEFTKRAWLNGRIDLTQAEAVIDLIRARTEAGMDLALGQLRGSLSSLVGGMRQDLRRLLAQVEAGIDFPDDVEDQERQQLASAVREIVGSANRMLATAKTGRIYREGLAVVLLGKPNAGKSTLLNRLLGTERALVTEIPGTTRDLIEETISVKGVPLRLIDTAGIRDAAGMVEALGISRAREALAAADLVLALFDATTPLEAEDRLVLELLRGKDALLLINKIDLPERRLRRQELDAMPEGYPVLEISARLGWGREKLEQAIIDLVGAGVAPATPAMLTRRRHQHALQRARDALDSALDSLKGGIPLDCIAVDLWDAWEALGEVLGEAVPDEIITAIFEEFCIGK